MAERRLTETRLYCVRSYSWTIICNLVQHTIDVHNAGAMSDQAVRGSQDIMYADAEAYFLDHLVTLFRHFLYDGHEGSC